MRNVAIFLVIGMVAVAGCDKIKEYGNKYAPMKLAVKSLTKAYKKATKDIKKAKSAEEVGDVFDYLARMHKSSNKTILKLQSKYSELQGLKKPEDYPKTLQSTMKEFQEVMKEFAKASQEKMQKYKGNKLMQNQVKKWMKAVQELK